MAETSGVVAKQVPEGASGVQKNPTSVRLLRIGDRLATAARDLSRGMKPTAGGDAFEYTGSMFTVEWLREILAEYDHVRIMEGE